MVKDGGNIYRFNPAQSSTAGVGACGAFKNEVNFETITSSIGASANKLAFAGFLVRGVGPYYP